MYKLCIYIIETLNYKKMSTMQPGYTKSKGVLYLVPHNYIPPLALTLSNSPYHHTDEM